MRDMSSSRKLVFSELYEVSKQAKLHRYLKTPESIEKSRIFDGRLVDPLEHNFLDAASQSVVSNGIIYISE